MLESIAQRAPQPRQAKPVHMHSRTLSWDVAMGCRHGLRCPGCAAQLRSATTPAVAYQVSVERASTPARLDCRQWHEVSRPACTWSGGQQPDEARAIRIWSSLRLGDCSHSALYWGRILPAEPTPQAHEPMNRHEPEGSTPARLEVSVQRIPAIWGSWKTSGLWTWDLDASCPPGRVGVPSASFRWRDAKLGNWSQKSWRNVL